MSNDALPTTIGRAGLRALTIIASGTVLALLYLGREVLVPIVLAIFLSLLMGPWVRMSRRMGLGQASSVLVAVLALAIVLSGMAAVIGSQVVHVAKSLPQYEMTIREKTRSLRDMTIGRMQAMEGEVSKVIGQSEGRPAAEQAAHAQPGEVIPAPSAAAVTANEAGSPMNVATRLLAKVWVPLQTMGIVLLVLVFVLLEHESLRDRFIRLVGGADLRATTAAINDAGERLSRFFLSTFSVNFGVGLAICLGLMALGVPNAPLWGALTAVLRFVPYVGVWLVAILTALFAAAVTPGWSLALMTIGLYVIIEMIAGQVVEPNLYGHTTGLSPLAVVVATIFWSWLWGPVGLIMSTPLTLCLLVAGRHVKALNVLNLLLGDTPALTLPQSFYQRALSGDSVEMIVSGREFLKRKSFAAYCDAVVLPALQLARIDLAGGAISADQQIVVRRAVAKVIETLDSDGRKLPRRSRVPSVLDNTNIGRSLREHREAASGRWQGPLSVAPGSIALCVSLGTHVDDLATELLTRILRDLRIDARHVSLEDIKAFDESEHPDLTPHAVSLVYVVSTETSKQREQGAAVIAGIRGRLEDAWIVAVALPEVLVMREHPEAFAADINAMVYSLEESAQQAIARFPKSS